MNGINQLIARGGVASPQPMPDVMGSYGKGMRTRAMQNQLRAQPEEQAWRREARGRQKKEWAQSDEDRKFKKEIDALGMAIKAGTPEKAKAIYENLNPDGAKYDFDFLAGKATVKSRTVEGFEIEGPQQAVEQLFQQFSDLGKDPAMMNQIFKRAAGMGVSVRAPEEKEEPKPTYEHHTIYGPEKATKRISYKKGTDYTPPEGWSLTKPEKVAEKKETPEEKLARAKELATHKAGLKGPGKPGEKKLTDIASDYQQAIGRYYTLMSGVGIMSEALGKKNEEMAKEAKDQADTLAKQYKALGGDTADLGVMEAGSKSLRDRAIELLKENNKLINEETIKKIMQKLEKIDSERYEYSKD